ncbi:MAG TPA: hypothetical protein VM432_07265 [Bdellovibrionales bacterium]|nr:hypothetical protein [Bdellovibrionales bacterium]
MQYDTAKYKIQKLPHPMLLHWVLNPGLVFNEIVLGQRVPAVHLIDRDKTKPLMERSFVPCPTCNHIHDGRLWAKKAGFGNWFGLVCPNCKEKIPCIWNVFSLLVLALTFPIWMPIKARFEKTALEWQVRRLNLNTHSQLPTEKEFSAIKLSLAWGSCMFLAFTIGPILSGQATMQLLVRNLLGWGLGGLMFGFAMKYVLTRKK